MSERAEKVLRLFEEQKDFVNARVHGGIELYRKGDVRIRVVNAQGEPVSGVCIEAKQTTQDFKFGANLFMLDELETAEKNAAYQQRFPELFNLATLPFYWRDIEPEQGKTRYTADSARIYRRPAPDKCIAYCQEKGIEPKLHCLNYIQHSPDWAQRLPAFEYKKHLAKRFREIGERYADKIPMIEVTNETFMGGCDLPVFFQDDICAWSFREAQKHFPANELIINDCFVQWERPYAQTDRNPYYLQIRQLLSENVPVHGIGMQYHSFTPRESEVNYAVPYSRYDPKHLCAVMDKLAELNLPMQITEMTIPAYSWDEEDEAIQAEILRNVYSLFFAQRNMEAIIYWNLPDGYAAWAPQGDMTAGENYYYGGLLRFDMSEKPAFKMLKKLIREEWMTNESLTTDGDGYANLRGFHGDYTLDIHVNGGSQVHQLHIGKDDQPKTVIITLDKAE